jgi:hypothetical protein
MMLVRSLVRARLRQIDPWTADNLNAEAAQAQEMLERLPIPAGEWIGPFGDPWLQTWPEMDPLPMCGLVTLNDDPKAMSSSTPRTSGRRSSLRPAASSSCCAAPASRWLGG